tara:strand:+ start:1022 stop:1828 length:807 start_codon:yes stop_codon:yes gene_type:complete
MSELYVFILRDVREKGKTKYNRLIPKLFSFLYNNPDKTISDVINYDKMKNHYKLDHKEIFKRNLNHSQLLQGSRYLSNKDIQKIIDINLKYFQKEKLTKKQFLKFIEHLFKGHGDMEYGIYFGSRKANNDKEFLESINRTNITNKNQTIIYYTKLNKLLDHIDKINEKYKFNTNLLYFNTNWQYGEKEDNSLDYTGKNRKKFISYLMGFTNEELEFSEIICHIPLKERLFKFTYRDLYGKTFKGGRSSRKSIRRTRRSMRRLIRSFTT